MQTEDFERFREVMGGLAELYQRELSKPLLDAYWVCLFDWEFEEFQEAAVELMRTQNFMPRPAQFTQLRKAGLPLAGESWAKVLAAVRGGAYRNTGVIVDALTDQAVRNIGGYQAIAMGDSSKTCFLEKRFCETFNELREVRHTREALPDLTSRYAEQLASDLLALSTSKRLS